MRTARQSSLVVRPAASPAPSTTNDVDAPLAVARPRCRWWSCRRTHHQQGRHAGAYGAPRVLVVGGDGRRAPETGPVPEQITDPGDPRLRDYVRLTDIALRLRSEAEHGLFLAEGELVLGRALDTGHRLRSVLLADNRWDLLEPGLRTRLEADGAPVYVGEPGVLEQVTGFHVHRGVLASVHRPPPRPVQDVLAGAQRVVVCEEVNNHTNIGALVRAAAALGVDALLLDPRSADPLYRRAVRVSMGAVFALPWARLAPWPAALHDLRAAGWRLLALTLAEGSVPLDQVRVAAGERVALLLGAEGAGLTAGAVAAAAESVTIPMAAGVDSLNVAAAAAVACWELRVGRDVP